WGPSGSASRPVKIEPRPSLGFRPAAWSASPYWAKVLGKNARTPWPKMIGSETFIIVALRCSEYSTPSLFARATWRDRNSRSATEHTGAAGRPPRPPQARARGGGRPARRRQRAPARAIVRDDRRALRRTEVVVLHVRHVGFRVGCPRAHAVRVRSRVVFDRGW